MYANRVILKLNRFNPNFQHYAILNIWTPTRNINFIQKCKDCLNTVLRGQGQQCQKEPLCDVTETCCSARAPLEEAQCEPQAVTTQYSANVVIIGAGMAGLSAANHLQDNGVSNITVLEALERPGGRIQSCWFGDSIIELGAPVGKPPATNPIVIDVFQDGLTTPPLNQADLSRGLLLRSDGSVIPYPLTFQVYQIFKQIWADAHEIEAESSFQSKVSIREFIGDRIDQEVRMFPSSQQIDAERIFLGLTSLVTAKSNHDSSLITTNDFGDFIQVPGSCTEVPLGYFGEINTLYESLPSDQVHFGKSVNKIRWGGVPDVFPRAVVITDGGEEFPADYVIITLPIGVLKALSDTLFCPGLPAAKLDAILKIPTGHMNKIFLEFTQPFWQWKRDFKKITFDFESMQCKEGWLKGVSSIAPIRGSSHVMCLTVAGPPAQCMESLTDQEVICDVITFLKEVFCKQNIPEPVKIKRTRWSCDPRFYGAYSYMGPGVCSKDFYSLASPLPEQTDFCDPVLLFAGAATCPVQFGTVRGARGTGIREAERLLQLVRLQEERKQAEEMDCECDF